jgi:S-adenosylmethionine hydrolase
MTGFGWISMTTDFGWRDGYAGVCHGVIAQLAPSVRVIDVSHLIDPGDVTRGARVMARAVRYLPRAVHVGVVDPGVGTDRRAVVLVAGGLPLVGPDNGLLLAAADVLGGVDAAYALTNDALWRRPVSRTFHGRDMFAPVAAHLASGVPVADVGEPVAVPTLVRLPEPQPGAVVDIDRFGNLGLAGYRAAFAPGDAVSINGRPARVGETYGAVAPGQLVVYTDSDGATAVAIRDGDAATELGLRVGDVVAIRKDD